MPEINSYPVSYVISTIEQPDPPAIDSGYQANSSVLFAAMVVGVIIIGVTVMSFTKRETT